jgi:hypothetical protein
MAASQWKETARVLKQQGVLTRPTDITRAFDSSFLESANPEKR